MVEFHQYALSPGGVFFRQNYGEEHELTVGLLSRRWTVKFYLSPIGSWTNVALSVQETTVEYLWPTWSRTNVALSFNSTTGLVVYVDGLSVGTDFTGSTRTYSASQYNEFNSLVVGRANDVYLEWFVN